MDECIVKRYLRCDETFGCHHQKTLAHPKADEGRHTAFRARIKAHEEAGKPIVYIDKSGFEHDMLRAHGYAQRGQKCHGKRDWNARGRMNVIGALLAAALLMLGLTEANVEAEIFNM